MTQEVIEFASSLRGQYIISQALHVAIETMDKETDIRFRESSNIEDMKYIKENLYNLFSTYEYNPPLVGGG